jgi:hypothetical protein
MERQDNNNAPEVDLEYLADTRLILKLLLSYLYEMDSLLSTQARAAEEVLRRLIKSGPGQTQ